MAAPVGTSPAKATWLPMAVGMSRAFVSLEFMGSSGKSRTGTCWIDSGGGELIVRRDFARELGLREIGKAVTQNGERMVPLEPPRITASDVKIPVAAGDALMLDSDRMISGVEADVLFPARLLRDHAVTFDYPSRRFGLDIEAPPGTPLPIEISAHSGFARVPLAVADQTIYALLDTGASCTMFSQALIDQLREAHPDWRVVRGAYDDANMLGGSFEANAQELLVPQLAINGITVPNVPVVSRPEGTFEKWMSSLTTGPIVGSLGGNVLRNFTVTIDYPNSRLFLNASDALEAAHPLALVALTLTPNDDGTYNVAQMLDDPSYSAMRAKIIGAQLVSIDGTPVSNRRISDVHNLLRGIPKTSKRITVSRDGRLQSYDLPVVVLWN